MFNEASFHNYYIHHCLFENCKEKGAIYIESYEEIFTLIEESVFNHCSSTSSNGGGSVYYKCQEEGHFVQKRTCYYKSVAQDFISFYLYLDTAIQYISSTKIYVFDISVSECGDNETIGRSTFCIKSSIINFSNNNISNNKCSQCSSLNSYVLGKSGTYNFSTFRENNQTDSESLSFSSINDSNPKKFLIAILLEITAVQTFTKFYFIV